jgi:single-stranded DNA-binding protein
MASFNQAIIMGNLVRDLEMKYSTLSHDLCSAQNGTRCLARMMRGGRISRRQR